jgi:hypothetical protein
MSDTVFLEMSPGMRALCSPPFLQQPLRTSASSFPPGFASPRSASMPPFRMAHPRQQTPLSAASVRGHGVARELEPLFAPVETPLLPAPVAAQAVAQRRLRNRRKTLAIHRTGFSGRRSSARIKDQG